jgi:hypothetical protein
VSDEVRGSTSGGLGLVLPASWWTIDLRDEQARRRSVTTVVDRQVGRSDKLAQLRADARTRLLDAASTAASAGGLLMAVSLMRAADVPISATLTLYRVPGAVGSGDALAALESTLRAAEPTDGVTLDIADGAFGPVLRRASVRGGPSELGARDVEMLVVDYWTDPGDGDGLVLLTFSTPLLDLREGMLDLFDAIVATLDLDDVEPLSAD